MNIQTAVYVPVLRWKRGERDALREMSATIVKAVWPLIELVPPRTDGWYGNIGPMGAPARVCEEVMATWGERPFLLDGQLLVERGVLTPRNKLRLYDELLDAAVVELFGVRQLQVSPVLRPKDVVDSGISRASSWKFNDLALRIGPGEISRPEFRILVVKSLLQLGFSRDKVHLLIDYCYTQSADFLRSDQIREQCEAGWRSVTLVGGSFPPDLQDLQAYEQHELRRLEFEAWRDFVSSMDPARAIPNFGDYTIQHPFYKDPPSGGGLKMSASIRYACDDKWVIMRGRSLELGGPHEWLAQARLLVDSADFPGTVLSPGDKYILDAAERFSAGQTDQPGSPTTWLQAGFNRHLEVTARAVSQAVDRTRTTATRKVRRRISRAPMRVISKTQT